ncbi:MAG TPA: hypothetical protein VLM42_08825 [Bryobacteraceae bacterium]|nr:hypothetical protein [Bryobacteraceae bacterium]
MGWVENTFADELVHMGSIGALWNAMRDSVGVAVQEFAKRTSGCGVTLTRKDCRARGQYCIRVEKGPQPSSIELFLDEEDKAFKVSLSTEPEQAKQICGYRLTPDRSELEFFEVVDGIGCGLSTETACEKAMRDFLFAPFPRMFAASDGKIVTR